MSIACTQPRARHEPHQRAGRAPLSLGGLVWALLAVACQAQDLAKDVNAVLNKAHLGSSKVGISIVEAKTGARLVAIHEDDRFIPASNLKLLTSGSALTVLGPDYEFRTRLLRKGSAIIVEGAGDPAFADPVLLADMHSTVDEFIDKLAGAAVSPAMKKVSEIIIDDRVFDRDYVHQDWPKNQLDKWYCAEVSGLNFHTNVLRVYAGPGEREADPAIIRVEPLGGGIEIVPRLRTTRTGETAVWPEREPSHNRFTIHGSIRVALDKPVEATMHEPALVFGRMLADRMASLGLAGADRITVRFAEPEENLAPADETIAVVRTPLSAVLARCNGDSHNLFAECLCKLAGHAATGQPGSWSSGAAVVRMQLREKLGPEAAAAVLITDGSGMSRTNHVTPGILARWLAAMSVNPRCADAFIESLPRARQEGSLIHRFERRAVVNEVRAKSGFVNGVRCLSGYVTHLESGRRIAFSILVNDIPSGVPSSTVKDFHEEVVQAIDQWLIKQAKLGN